MMFPVAERFKAPQGEGLYTGTPMAFIRLVGCSVGQKVCHACDTDFDRINPELGGGLYTAAELAEWAGDYEHICLTGGEPFDRDLRHIIDVMGDERCCHIETSGTKCPEWLPGFDRTLIWITVSPKPGYLAKMINMANEIKVILGGLGDGPGWPTLDDALAWSENHPLVYIQPRNSKLDIDPVTMAEAIRAITEHPTLRLSIQAHKYLRVR